MKLWLAPLSALLLSGCLTYPPPSSAPYRAVGQEPGWTLVIDERDLTFIPAGGQPVRQPRPQAIIGIAVFLTFLYAGLYLTSPYFQEWMRGKLVSELELVTGGRVELESFHWRLTHLDFQALNLTIHGLEKPGEAPFMHFDRLDVKLKIISFLGRQLGFRSITAEHPVFHIIAYPG